MCTEENVRYRKWFVHFGRFQKRVNTGRGPIWMGGGRQQGHWSAIWVFCPHPHLENLSQTRPWAQDYVFSRVENSLAKKKKEKESSKKYCALLPPLPNVKKPFDSPSLKSTERIKVSSTKESTKIWHFRWELVLIHNPAKFENGAVGIIRVWGSTIFIKNFFVISRKK